MPIISADCPRCGIKKMTFSVKGWHHIGANPSNQQHYEFFAICNECKTATIFIVFTKKTGISEGSATSIINGSAGTSLNEFFRIKDFVKLRDSTPHPPPDFIPEDIKAVFEEGAECFSIGCWNAAGAMFRTCLDLTTKNMLPQEEVGGLTKRHRENLAARIDWFFENNKLPERLRDIADCVRQDGNDGAHDGTLGEMEAIDLLEFTIPILEHFYTQPEKIKRTRERRAERRKKLTEGEGEEQSEANGEEQTA